MLLLLYQLPEQDALCHGHQTDVEDPVEDSEKPEVTGIIGESSVGVFHHHVPTMWSQP